MNDYIVTQQDIDLLMQSTKTLYYKLELLNENLKIVESIEGNLISDNISISADSDVRRAYNCELIVTDSTFNLGKEKKIWFDKRVKPYVGILYQRERKVIWYCLGTFLFVDTNYSYDAITNKLSITCNDMMCLLNDVRKGQLDAYNRTIKAGSDARNVIISLLQEVGITKFYIEFNINNKAINTFEIPYDLSYSAGTNAYTIINEIVNLYSGTQMYFSVDGIFVISRIPTSENEINVLDNTILQKILISEQTTTSLSGIYNKIEVWGRVNEPDFYTKEVSLINEVYCVNLVYSELEEGTEAEIEYDEYKNFDVLAINIPTSNLDAAKIKINDLEEIPIVDDQGNSLPMNYLESGLDYVFRYRKLTNDFLYLGQYQVYGEAYLTNKNDASEYAIIDEDNDFAIEVLGERLKVLSGGEYENIYSNGLCNQRAKWELMQTINLGSTLNLEIVAVPWLDVNMIVEFTSNSTNETHLYIIKDINCNYSDFQMTLNLSRYYPNYI